MKRDYRKEWTISLLALVVSSALLLGTPYTLETLDYMVVDDIIYNRIYYIGMFIWIYESFKYILLDDIR